MTIQLPAELGQLDRELTLAIATSVTSQLTSILEHPSTRGAIARAIDRHPTDPGGAAIAELERILHLVQPPSSIAAEQAPEAPGAAPAAPAGHERH